MKKNYKMTRCAWHVIEASETNAHRDNFKEFEEEQIVRSHNRDCAAQSCLMTGSLLTCTK